MRRALEIIFRHPLRLLLLIMVLPVISVAVAFTLPRSYQATATLWASEPFVIVASGVGTGYTPAASQEAVLVEFLKTRSFALQVAHAAGVPASGGNTRQQEDALFAEISSKVQVSTSGDNLVTIAYTNKDPGLAQKVVLATIENYGSQAISYETGLSQQLLQYDKEQLTQAQEGVAKATQTIATYLAAHPYATPQQLASDPQYLNLQAQQTQAQAILTNLQNEINTLNYSVAVHAGNSNNLYTVVDPPSIPNHGVSRSKEILLAGVGALLVGLLAIVVYVTLAMRRDRSIYDAHDLAKITDRPLVGVVPVLHSGTITRMLPSSREDADRA